MVNILLTSESRYPVNRKAVRQAVIDVLNTQKISSSVEVSILIIGDRKMRELNKKYMRKDETTDVLSFPLGNGTNQYSQTRYTRYPVIPSAKGFINPPDNVLRLGDVVISFPQAVKQAAENNILVDSEINNLVRHGVMHLLGINHGE